MEYIEPEEFLKQTKKVQESLRNWWKPEMRDLFFRSFGDSPNSFLNEIYIGCIQDNETKNNAIAYKDFLPVLTEGQLRKYIEDKNGKIDCIGITGNDYGISTFTKDYGIEHATDLLDAYWQVACRIAEEE